LGRAPGTDQFTAAALNEMTMAMDFQLMWKNYNYIFLREIKKGEYAQFPRRTRYSNWILGSSTESAYLAAAGLPYVFASHFVRHNFSMQ
jgi:hypothetical protein